MKFTATFAVLAVFVSKAVVSAAPTPAYDSLLEARSEFVESALEEVWARFYDELLEGVEAREYVEDLFEAREYDEDILEAREYDEDIFERSPMKKFAGDLATNLAQKAPQYAQQYSQSQESKARNSQPRFAHVVQQAQAQAKSGSVPKPAAAKLPASSKWNTVKKPSVMAEIKKASKPSLYDQTKGAFRKTRSLDDIDDFIFERSPMKKFGQDLATNLAQKAPQYAQQYSQSQESKARSSQPRFAQVVQQAQAHAKPAAPKLPASSKWNTVKQPSVMADIKKAAKPSLYDQTKGAFRKP
ncbi:hypothetical protein BKA70DRAFT_1429065 [Coprinopsis sp. MPI-PUGE-AT-0042]|nr:hypothetical protein BKA70DRAFT_1429065 [Coprinopsis sp. MPI-PUGE-AT-0042]